MDGKLNLFDKLFIVILLISLGSFSNLCLGKQAPLIRVKVYNSLPSLNVVGEDVQRYLYPKHSKKTFKGTKRIKFNCQGLFLTSQKKRKPILLAHLSSPSGFLDLGREKFKGNLMIATNPNGESCDVIHQVDLETYLPPLLSKEMHGSWPLEALKAQAVAARTYAAHKIKTQEVSKTKGHEVYYDLENSEKHQVSGSFADATKKTVLAQRETSGEVLVSKTDNALHPIFFHAESAGRTLLPEEVWDHTIQDYYSVAMPYLESSIKWQSQIPLSKIREFFNWYLNKGKDLNFEKFVNNSIITVTPDKITNYVFRIYLDDQVFIIRKPLLRKYFGRNFFESSSFVVSFKNRFLVVEGQGSGHGVGMSQIGAKRLAEKGYTYKQILSYYYPGFRLKKMY